MTSEEIKNKLAEKEKYIAATKKLRDDAIKAKTESETKIEIATEELKKLGVNPSNAEAEIQRLNTEIETELEKIGNSIPMDLLKEMGRI